LVGIFGFTVGPFLRRGGLHALGWGCLHPPSNGCLHSYSLEGYTGGKLRRRV
jgi:hypothetical protein